MRTALILATLLAATGGFADEASAQKRLLKGTAQYTFDGFKLGDNYQEKVMNRPPYDQPCDNDPIDNNARRFMIYGALPCRDLTFPNQTTVMFYLKYSAKARYAQPIEAFAFLHGDYFSDKSNFFIQTGDKMEDARAKLGAIVNNFTIKRKQYTLEVIQSAGDVYILHNNETVVGLVIGGMPEDPENEQWRGLMQMYQRYTPKGTAAHKATPTSSFKLSQAEQELYDLMMADRAKEGLEKIPVSPSLTRVARLHVADLNDNKPDAGECNMHSWSDQGKWTACCYTPDHAQAKCMWDKPKELTSYKGAGFEVSYNHSARATPAGALRSWQGSSGHSNVIMSRGKWAKKWQAVGIGIGGNFAVAWFGRSADPATK